MFACGGVWADCVVVGIVLIVGGRGLEVEEGEVPVCETYGGELGY
jgi:hypothetical protein